MVSYHDICVSIDELDELFKAPEAALQTSAHNTSNVKDAGISIILCQYSLAPLETFAYVLVNSMSPRKQEN
jgi:hypothetical protein